MSYVIFKQPNGLYLYFDTDWCCPIAYNLSDVEALDMIINVAREQGLNDIDNAKDLKECKNLFAPVNIEQREFYDILRECKKPVEKNKENDKITEHGLLNSKDYIRTALGVYSGTLPKNLVSHINQNNASDCIEALKTLDKLVDKELMTSCKNKEKETHAQ